MELIAFGGVGQFAFEQEVRNIEKIVSARGQLLDGVAAIKQLAFIAVDISNGRLAGCS